MTEGRPCARTRPYVQRKPDKYVFIWSPRIEIFVGLTKDKDIKVDRVAEWLSERYVPFRAFKPLFKKIVVGKCLKHLGHEKYSHGEQGWVYRRAENVI